MIAFQPEAQARDLRAEFERVARVEAPALYRTARRLARPPAEAGDLVQETLLRAYRTFGNFTPGTNARAWLLTILYSVAANAADRKARRPEVGVDDLEREFERAVRGTTGREELALLRQIDASPQVDAALADLSDAFRAAVLLVDIEDLTYEEAAAVVGCPVGTLRSRLFRARRHLFLSLCEHAREVGLLGRRRDG